MIERLILDVELWWRAWRRRRAEYRAVTEHQARLGALDPMRHQRPS